jgi:hypothetical protein
MESGHYWKFTVTVIVIIIIIIMAQQPNLSLGLLQKLPPGVLVPCGIPPVFFPPTSWHHPSRRPPILVSAYTFAFFLLLLQPGLFLQGSVPPVEEQVLLVLGG